MTSPDCWTCGGDGVVCEPSFDGFTCRPCPTCQWREAKARAARQFGTDAERRRIKDDAKRRPMSPPRQTS